MVLTRVTTIALLLLVAVAVLAMAVATGSPELAIEAAGRRPG